MQNIMHDHNSIYNVNTHLGTVSVGLINVLQNTPCAPAIQERF